MTGRVVASTRKPHSLTSIAGFADIGCCSSGRRESKSKRNNKEDVCVNGVDLKNDERCLVCCRFVCFQCLLRAAGQILERRNAPPGAVSLPPAFTPEQDEKLVEVRKDGHSGFLPACVIWLKYDVNVPQVILVIFGET